MGMRMMRWSPWPPLVSKKFEVLVVVRRLEGLNCVQFDEDKELVYVKKKKKRLVVEMKWMGQKAISLNSLRKKTVKKNCTEEGGFCGDGVVEWNEEFNSLCSFSGYTDGIFLPWEIAFTVFNGSTQGPKNNKVPVVGTASLNLAEYADLATEKELEIQVPLTVSTDKIHGPPSLCLSIRLMETRIAQEPTKTQQSSIMPLTFSPSSVDALPAEKYERSPVRAGLQKVKIFKDCVSSRRTRKKYHQEEGSDGRSSVRSDDAECNFAFDTASLNDDAQEESDENSSFRKSFSYETLALANFVRDSCYTNTIMDPEDESWINYNSCKSDVENSTTPVFKPSLRQSVKRRIFPWRKSRLSFRSSKKKGEPLLKKESRDEGGDDIDFDRRQLSSSDESIFGWTKSEGSSTSRSSFSDFGDDNFAVGSWEKMEVISRDGHMKLLAQVFFASIDQRSERAAGESACTALVAIIANWLHSNRDEMPIKSEFDSLIREGSLAWRNLCENEDYIRWFPDKHFDLETVLQAKIRPLCEVPEKSFIGFFHPEGLEGGDFDFLHSAMSFDNIWEEIVRYQTQSDIVDPLIYIISWNDHFFLLKVEQDAYYIIDTLGERLSEGCNQAYVLKFDKDTTICQLSKDTKLLDEKSASDNKVEATTPHKETSAQEEVVVCRGKDSCKEYIKNFLAAIPIRELQDDIKKGLKASTPLHHRLQIEFHYTHLSQPVVDFPSREVAADDA